MKKIAVHDHQGKSRGIFNALHGNFELVEFGEPADILLIDHDATPYYKKIIKAYTQIGAKVFLYPHGATAHLAWDGIWNSDQDVSCYLAFSDGQKECMTRYGYPKPIRVTGWSWCGQNPFTAWNMKGKAKVLYAPIHALNNGFLYHEVLEMNAWVFDQLRRLPIDLKVRYIHSLDSCGIDKIGGVEYKRGNPTNSTDDIDQADFVVSFGTFLYLAVARGKPSIAYRQDIPYFDGHAENQITFAEHWDYYGDFMKYPVDIGDFTSPVSAFKAANNEDYIRQWKDLFIGPQITPDRMKDILYYA